MIGGCNGKAFQPIMALLPAQLMMLGPIIQLNAGLTNPQIRIGS